MGGASWTGMGRHHTSCLETSGRDASMDKQPESAAGRARRYRVRDIAEVGSVMAIVELVRAYLGWG